MPENPTKKPKSTFDFHKLKTLREDRKMTLVDLGIRLYHDGVCKTPATRQQIWDWEEGKCRPNSATLYGLAEIFGVTMESFFKRTEEESP